MGRRFYDELRRAVEKISSDRDFIDRHNDNIYTQVRLADPPDPEFPFRAYNRTVEREEQLPLSVIDRLVELEDI